MPEYGLIIFDNDGVLSDSEKTGCEIWVEELQKNGIRISFGDFVSSYNGQKAETVLAALERRFGKKIPADFVSVVEDETERRMRESLLPVKGVLETLPLLHLPMCIASGGRPSRLKTSLSVTGLDRFFTAENTFSSYLVKNGKPAPDIFLYAADKTGFSPSDCLVVEDSVSGIVGAKAAGMTAFGFIGGSHCTPERGTLLKKAGADFVFDDFTRLPDLLDQPSSR